MEEWREIDSFPGYSVSNSGRVRNEDTGRLLVLTRNQQGIINVGLCRSLTQHKRSVARLVATAFVPPTNEAFDTPINLDGDRSNNNVENLMWRPRWFAIRYFQQFHDGERNFDLPVMDIKTKEEFASTWEAVVKYGILEREILLSVLRKTYVWPTYQTFKAIR